VGFLESKKRQCRHGERREKNRREKKERKKREKKREKKKRPNTVHSTYTLMFPEQCL